MTTAALIMDGNRASSINIVIWICFVVSGFAVVAKIGSKIARRKNGISLGNLQLDDGFLGLALLLAAAHTLAVSQQVSRGLGIPLHSRIAGEEKSYEKLYYTSQILYILSLSFTKAAAFCFALTLQSARHIQIMLQGGLVLCILWSITSTFGIIFQCRAPDTWKVISGQCFDRVAFWAYVEVVNAFTDSVLGCILCAIVWILKMSSARYILILVFSSRIVIILPITFRLIYIFDFERQSRSPGAEANIAFATAAVMNTSIVMTCVPFLKVLMEHLQPGWSTSDVRRGVGFTVAYGKTVTMSTIGQFPSGSVLAKQIGSRKVTLESGTSKASGKSTDKPDVGILRCDEPDCITNAGTGSTILASHKHEVAV